MRKVRHRLALEDDYILTHSAANHGNLPLDLDVDKTSHLECLCFAGL